VVFFCRVLLFAFFELFCSHVGKAAESILEVYLTSFFIWFTLTGTEEKKKNK